MPVELYEKLCKLVALRISAGHETVSINSVVCELIESAAKRP